MAGVNGVNPGQPEIKIVDPDKVGFAGLTSEDFMKILIVQLQNQDPTSPMEADQLLSQISDMRNLQANLQLETSLKSLTLGQQLGSATAFIGKTVTGTSGKDTVTGMVTGVQVREGSAYLKISDDVELKMSDVETVTE